MFVRKPLNCSFNHNHRINHLPIPLFLPFFSFVFSNFVYYLLVHGFFSKLCEYYFEVTICDWLLSTNGSTPFVFLARRCGMDIKFVRHEGFRVFTKKCTSSFDSQVGPSRFSMIHWHLVFTLFLQRQEGSLTSS